MENAKESYMARALRDYFSPPDIQGTLGPAGAAYAWEKTHPQGEAPPIMLQKAEEPYRLQRIKAGLSR